MLWVLRVFIIKKIFEAIVEHRSSAVVRRTESGLPVASNQFMTMLRIASANLSLKGWATMGLRIRLFSWMLAGTALFAGTARAKQTALELFCDVHATSPLCASGALRECSTCHLKHQNESATSLNGFGKCLQKQGATGAAFEDKFPEALRAIGSLDCDGDGVANITEILAGTLPSDPLDKPKDDDKAKEGQTCADRRAKSRWNVCGYDADFVFKKIHQDFCGATPTYEAIQAFAKLDESAKTQRLENDLEECLRSENWIGKEGVVWRLAHYKVMPLQTLKSGVEQGQIPLADYYDDYNLFVYHHIEGRDVRGILTADYFVERQDNPTTYTPVEERTLVPGSKGMVGSIGPYLHNTQQFVPKERRAGMLTTLWNSTMRTMFAHLPRTNASQAMRGFLNIDMAKSEGLVYPPKDYLDRTFKDYDNRGVTAGACGHCHAVLDPLTYPWTRYNGLENRYPLIEIDISKIFNPELDNGPNQFEKALTLITDRIPGHTLQWVLDNQSLLLAPGTYSKKRMETLGQMYSGSEPLVAKTPEAGYLLGKPVKDLVEWAEVAANSEEFARATVLDYWRILIGEELLQKHNREYTQLWQGLMTEDQYSVEAMLRKLVKTEAYGAP